MTRPTLRLLIPIIALLLLALTSCKEEAPRTPGATPPAAGSAPADSAEAPKASKPPADAPTSASAPPAGGEEAPTEEKEAEPPAEEPEGDAAGLHTFELAEDVEFGILEAAVCTGIDREGGRSPIDPARRFSRAERDKLTFYMSVRNKAEATTLEVVWKQAGEEKARTDLEIGEGKAWRTWAHKRLPKKRSTGDWTVEVQGEGGKVLGTFPFEVVE